MVSAAVGIMYRYQRPVQDRLAHKPNSFSQAPAAGKLPVCPPRACCVGRKFGRFVMQSRYHAPFFIKLPGRTATVPSSKAMPHAELGPNCRIMISHRVFETVDSRPAGCFLFYNATALNRLDRRPAGKNRPKSPFRRSLAPENRSPFAQTLPA